jgi:hypothetical protein
MTSIWTALPEIGTGISLVAFVVAIVFYAYRSHLKSRATIIANMPEQDRLKAIDATAEFLRVDVTGLTSKAKHDIVSQQLRLRARRDTMLAGIALVVAILLGIVAILAIVMRGDEPPPPGPVVQKCYRFDPQTGQESKSLGERPCFPGRLVFVKYWDPSDYPSPWPKDRPNRVLQVTDTASGQPQWIEQDLTAADNHRESWGIANHFWVTVMNNMGLGEGVVGTVLRRVDLQPIPVGDGKTQCDSPEKMRSVLEFGLPKDAVSILKTGTYPTIRMRWLKVACGKEVGFSPIDGGDFTNTDAQIRHAVADAP